MNQVPTSDTYVNELPLYDFFKSLQKNGHYMLGMDSYLVLIEALDKGLGLTSAADLYCMCRTILLKPGFDENVFKQLFSIHLDRIKEQIESKNKETPNASKENNTDDNLENNNTHSDKLESAEKKENDLENQEKSNSSDQQFEDSKQESITVSFEEQSKEGIKKGKFKKDFDEESIKRTKFIIDGEYHPISSRKMKQSWRTMRTELRSSKIKELNLEATIESTVQKGYCKEAIFSSPEENIGNLFLLIDHCNSMTAFHSMGNKLAETAVNNTGKANTEVYYFRKYVKTWLYKDMMRSEKVETKKHIDEVGHASIFIFSDAGAAQGIFSDDQMNKILAFLKRMKNHRIAWLNPMPRPRWEDTCAEYVSYYVPMFSPTDQEFANSVNLLRGKIIVQPELKLTDE